MESEPMTVILVTLLIFIKRGKKIDSSHGAVFPLELASTVIENFSHNNATILDPFMGTGTTGVACVNTGRKFIGIELDQSYFDIAVNRIFGKGGN